MQNPQPFKLERYFDRYEFNVPYLLSPSDCESLTLSELLSLAGSQARDLWDSLSLGYTEAAGHQLLRQKIASLHANANSSNVLILTPEEGIFITMHTLLSPGDEVICISPAYQSLHEVARSIGCRVIPWTLSPSSTGWSLDLDQLAGIVSDKTRLMVINFPHNPTGYLPSKSVLESVIALARERRVYVFSDEMYRLLEYDAQQRLPAVSDIYERGISLSGMSKSLAMPGLRIGWLVTSDKDLRDRWIAFKDYTTICNSAPSEILALMGLNAMDQILYRNLIIIQGNLAVAQQFFANHTDTFEWFPPLAGSVAFPRWIGSGTIDELCQDLVDQQGVMVVPGSLFDVHGGHFRLGLGRRNFSAALERVEQHIIQKKLI
jgi:aspartate/methionine/tyrosine aminotransferase